MPFAESFVTCKPTYINNGHYEPDKQAYMLNERVEAHCERGYYLFGALKKTCSSLRPGDEGDWVPMCTESDDCPSECLTASRYEERCKETGKHATFFKGRMDCEESEGGLSTFCYI